MTVPARLGASHVKIISKLCKTVFHIVNNANDILLSKAGVT
jgi:hypothetical protein